MVRFHVRRDNMFRIVVYKVERDLQAIYSFDFSTFVRSTRKNADFGYYSRKFVRRAVAV